MRILKTNLCTELATTVASSSANVNFPVSNLKNPLRSKRWRSSGYFEIGSSNYRINFKESAMGSELTANISGGTYSIPELIEAIKFEMELVGSNEYTVSYSQVTGLWTISSNGSYFAILNATGSNQLNSILKNTLGFPNTDKTGALTYTGSIPAIHSIESIVFDFKTIQDIDSVVLMWPKEDGIKLSSDAVIKVEANATDTWNSPALSVTLTIDETYSIASHFFSSVEEYRYWRITIVDPQNPYLHVELGMIWIGESIEFNEPENGFSYKLKDTSKVSVTDFGNEYVDSYPLIASLEFNFNYIDYTTAKILENSFRENGTKKPLIVVFDETSTVFNKNHFLIYGKFDSTYSSDQIFFNYFKGSIKITELG